ncbi:hypothetical protein LguiB_004674 [Lonicera macranthoides]
METGGSTVKKTTLTPKAIIHQRFGSNACYKVEEVEESNPNGCPGLAIQRKGPCLYRCFLQLPEFSVVSETCKRKKEAEQSAAEKAIEKLGIDPTKSNPNSQEAWDELVGRLSYAFSTEFLSAIHPLSGHFRAALRREAHYTGFVPISVISIYDAKLISLCKYINPETESNPFLVMSLVTKAAAKLLGSVSISEDQLSIRKEGSYPSETLESLVDQQSSFLNDTWISAVRVPYSDEKSTEALTLNISDNIYYLDVIAQELGVTDASQVLISRPIGRASSEMRLYWANKSYKSEESLNTRARYFSGQKIYGDAILASVGYTWRSLDLFYEDVSLCTYYRLLINKTPSGAYKLSRESILAAELPLAFTTRSNWRGSTPREILCTFCRLHRLSEPVFPTASSLLTSSLEGPGSSKKLKVTKSSGETNGGGTFKCNVKIFSKCQDLILACSPKVSFKKQNDAIQNAALKVLSFLNIYFKNLNISLEKLTSYGDELDIQLYAQHFSKEFELSPLVHKYSQSMGTCTGSFLDSNSTSQLNVEGQGSGTSPFSGCLVCISYSVYVVSEGESMKDLLESSEEFEFEIGNGVVTPVLEAVVMQMFVGQSASFNTELPPQELILAAGDSTRTPSILSLTRGCSLQYSVTLLRVTEPLEDRMEQALFSPPLSKQRVEYALQHIKESCATSLVDFGCGSGSLLDSLLDYSTSLEKIIGVDISQKSLSRAAKILHSKLNTASGAAPATNGIKSAFLFEGSITDFDSRLYGSDIGTCLEVIEHMEEDQACLFGDAVLSLFCPRILIVSTPNYEYNVILQKSTLQSQEEDPEDKNQTQSCKFRNHDHKFEWTREQFNSWASELAQRHNYRVEFSGVGGVFGVEPGFASQIAVFRRGEECPMTNTDESYRYDVIWEWSSTNTRTVL